MQELAPGRRFTPLPSTPGGMADFIRANLFDRTMMRASRTAPGPDNDLPTSRPLHGPGAADPAARV